MMVTALLLRPWLAQMKLLAVEPRLLADDLQIICTGARHAEHFQHAFDKTHEQLEDLGAKLAPTKSMTFLSELATRNWLRTHRWRRLGKVVKVVTDCRDIGTHLTATSGRRRGATLSTSMKETTKSTTRLANMKVPYHTKARAARGKIMPKHCIDEKWHPSMRQG